jgi:polysaccharide biosynthesis transport protein
MDDERQDRSVIELAKEVWGRRKWLAIWVAAVPLVAGLSLILFLPSVYRSTVTVLVDRQQVPETFVRPTVTSALETRLHTINQEILSRSRLEALMTRFGLYADLRKRVASEEVIERMRRDIQLELKGVEQKEGRAATIAFFLSYRGSDPATVAQVANTLASFYIEENLKVRERQAAGTAEFLKVQLAATKGRLDDQERVVSEFKKKYLGELPQQLDTNLATIERLSSQLRSNGDSQMRAIERREVLLKQLADAGDLTGATGPDALADQLARQKEELRQLRAKFSERYPDVVRAKEQVAAIERELAEGKNVAPKDLKAAAPQTPYTMRIRQALVDVEAELNVLKGEEKRLRGAVGAYLGRVENSPKREQEFKELSRDYESTKELYSTLSKRYEEAQLAESMEQRQKGEQFRVLDSAVPASAPAAPNRPRLMLMALALSLGLGVAVVLLAEQLNPAFHSVDDLRAFTTAPVLVSIPRIVTSADTAKSQRRARFAVAFSAAGLVLVVGIAYFVAHGNEQMVSLLLSPSRSVVTGQP